MEMTSSCKLGFWPCKDLNSSVWGNLLYFQNKDFLISNRSCYATDNPLIGCFHKIKKNDGLLVLWAPLKIMNEQNSKVLENLKIQIAGFWFSNLN